MSFTAYCPTTLTYVALPGELFEGSYYMYCLASEWAGEGPGQGVECAAGTVVAPPGTYLEIPNAYYVGCAEGFSAVDSDIGPLPAALDPAVAGGMFMQGFGIVFAFWALGKVPALVIRLIR